MIDKNAPSGRVRSSRGSAGQTPRHVDAVIVGGGIVGMVQALLLAQQGNSVLLIEATGIESATASVQQRSVALSHRSYELLAAKGLWPANAACPITEIHVTDRGNFGSARITARDLNTAALGYVVANHSFEHHLLQLLRSQKNIEFLQPATATLLHNSNTGAELRVSLCGSEQGSSYPVQAPVQALDAEAGNDAVAAAGREFTARCNLLIAADGTHSKIRQALGLKLKQHNYDQVAVVANVECQFDHQHIAHERFTESGPLALLPLSPRCMAMVYTARECDSELLKAMPDEKFLQLLQLRFGGKLGRFKSVGRRAVFPLMLSESESQTNGSCVLIGNSVRTLHPVAGQGLNLALRDVFALAACVGQSPGFGLEAGLAHGEGADPGLGQGAQQRNIDLLQMLADFERQRWRDQRGTVRRTDLLARVFSINTIAMGPLRGASLALLNGFAPLRKRFAAESAGLGVSLGRPRDGQSQIKVE